MTVVARARVKQEMLRKMLRAVSHTGSANVLNRSRTLRQQLLDLFIVPLFGAMSIVHYIVQIITFNSFAMALH